MEGRELETGDKVLVNGDSHIYLFSKDGDAFVCNETDWFNGDFMLIAKSYSMDKVIFSNM